MTYSVEFRERAITLLFFYDISVDVVHLLLGPSKRTLHRWRRQFEKYGVIRRGENNTRTSRWSTNVIAAVKSFVEDHPCAYLEEIQQFIEDNYPECQNRSLSTVCRALRFDMGLSRKVITKRAREAVGVDALSFWNSLCPFYAGPEQLVFVDETSKDGRAAIRKYAWSPKGTPAIVRLPFSRGRRVSVLAALGMQGFIAWETTRGTFDRARFHQALVTKILPKMNRYPAPCSILVLDNARIHSYQELLDAAEAVGVLVIFLPPYSPWLNPIEFTFSFLKRWISKNANLAFPHYPELVLDIAMKECTKGFNLKSTFQHCGYGSSLKQSIILNDLSNT